jgi:hypothetical protein
MAGNVSRESRVVAYLRNRCTDFSARLLSTQGVPVQSPAIQ